MANEQAGNDSIKNEPPQSPIQRWLKYIQEPVDGASLAIFRICFGVAMAVNVYMYTIKINFEYLQPRLNFPIIPGITRLSHDGMFLLYEVMAGAACCIALGFYYRFACLVFGLCWTYTFLLDKTYYQNHFYLICLLSFLLFITPANRVWSMDTWGKNVSRYVPRWTLLAFKLQFFIVYFYGGIAKLNPDWLSGHPVSEWMTFKTGKTVLGDICGQHWFHLMVIWGGLFLDLTAGFFLFWRKTFWLGFLETLPFHLLNSQLFSIGIFPWMMLSTNGVFAPPDWPRLVYKKIGLAKLIGRFMGNEQPAATTATAASTPVAESTSTPISTPTPGAATTLTPISTPTPVVAAVKAAAPVSSWTPPFSKAAMSVLGVYFVWQFLFPLRCFLYPDYVNWTEEGHRFSWRMMLRDKQIAVVELRVINPQTGESDIVPFQHYINLDQLRQMAWQPDMLLQMAHFVADEYEKKTGVRPIVTGNVVASLNYRPYQPMIDTSVDLASKPETFLHKDWVIPLRYKGFFTTALSSGNGSVDQ